jgi:membrane dipeptidase
MWRDGRMSVSSRYKGYKSFSYLTPDLDYQVFELEGELDRVPPYDLGLTSEEAARAEQLLASSVVISLHEHPLVYPRRIAETAEYYRTGRAHTGFEGLAHSGMTAVFDNMLDGTACVTGNAPWRWDDIITDLGMRQSDIAHQDFVTVGRSVADILAAHEQGQLALVFGLEAATPIENELDRIEILYGLGVRQLGITYSQSNALGAGIDDASSVGLTGFGRRAVERMNKIGMAIDVSHASDQTGIDTCEVSTKPVLVTHAGARSIWDIPRLKSDELLTAVAGTGGVIGISAAAHTTISANHRTHNLESYMDHFSYCVDLIGKDHVAFGPDTIFADHVGLHKLFTKWLFKRVDGLGRHADLQGREYEPVEYVAGLESPTENFRNIIGWLVKHGWSDDDIQAVVGGNIIRALTEIWGA